MSTQTLCLAGKSYVVRERAEYERLTTLAKAADLPPLGRTLRFAILGGGLTITTGPGQAMGAVPPEAG